MIPPKVYDERTRRKLQNMELARRKFRSLEQKEGWKEKKINRQRRLMDLMRHRTTVEQGLTSMQVFKEMYYDLVEHYDKKVYYGMMDYLHNRKEKHIKRSVNRLQKRDEFRWLSLVPLKDKKTDRIREFRWVNIKVGEYGSYGYNLLTEVNRFWTEYTI